MYAFARAPARTRGGGWTRLKYYVKDQGYIHNDGKRVVLRPDKLSIRSVGCNCPQAVDKIVLMALGPLHEEFSLRIPLVVLANEEFVQINCFVHNRKAWVLRKEKHDG